MSGWNMSKKPGGITKIGQYQDDLHAEELDGLKVGDHGYKYRVIDGLVLPPYVTPDRLAVACGMKTRAGDISYCSYPKSGSTWLSNILYLILHDGEVPQGTTLRNCLHWMESSWPYPRDREEVEALPSPRIFKSHMPLRMALGGGPENSPAKFIYIARNPKDVCVSYFHFESGKAWSGNYGGQWEHWLRLFIEGGVQRGDWFDHVLSWWEHRELDNLLFLRYEDMKRDFDGELRKIIDFLDYDLTQEVVARIKEATSFSHMKKAEFSNHQEITDLEDFFRKGQIGSWREVFTAEQSEAFDRVYQERMQGTGLDFFFG
jgi:hypothetical protein